MAEKLPSRERSQRPDLEKLSNRQVDPQTVKLRDYLDQSNALLRQWIREENLPEIYAPKLDWNSIILKVEDWDSGKSRLGEGEFTRISFLRGKGKGGIVEEIEYGTSQRRVEGYPSE